jgi:hypothetical protein
VEAVTAENAGTPGPHHTADPSALEDPVHHDVAVHELHEEHEHDTPEPAAPEPTGDERVDAAVQRLDEVTRTPPEEHVAIYEDVHKRLQDTLAELDGS